MEVRQTHHNHHHQQAAVDLAPVTQRYFSPICVNLAKNKERKEREKKKSLFASTFSSHSIHFLASVGAPVIIFFLLLFLDT